MKSTDYVIWGRRRVKKAAFLSDLHGIEAVHELLYGVPRATSFSEDAVWDVDEDAPPNGILPDSINNPYRLLACSRRLVEFLQASEVPRVEYLPVAIRNPKGRIISKDVFIVHPLEPVDCLDVDKSSVEWSPIAETDIDRVARVVLDESKLDPTRQLFRLAKFPDLVLVRRDLANSIDAEGFTGMRWIELNEYPED
jgi:hypothetical protein